MVPRSSISELHPIFFCCPLFFQRILKSTKWSIKSVDYHLSSSGLTSRIHPVLFFFLSPKGFMSFQNVCLIFSQTCILQHRWGTLCCSNYWKMHLQFKKLNLDIFTYAPYPKAKFSHRFLLSPPRGKLLIPSSSIFFEFLSPPQQKGGEEIMQGV